MADFHTWQGSTPHNAIPLIPFRPPIMSRPRELAPSCKEICANSDKMVALTMRICANPKPARRSAHLLSGLHVGPQHVPPCRPIHMWDELQDSGHRRCHAVTTARQTKKNFRWVLVPRGSAYTVSLRTSPSLSRPGSIPPNGERILY